MNGSSLPLTCRNGPKNGVKTKVASLPWDEPGGYPFTAQVASGI